MRIGHGAGYVPGSGIDSVKNIAIKIEKRLGKIAKGTGTLWGRMVCWVQGSSLSKTRAEKRQILWDDFKKNSLPNQYGTKVARQAIATWEAENGSTSLTDRKVSLYTAKAKVRAHANEINAQITQINVKLIFDHDHKDYSSRLPQGAQSWTIAARMHELIGVEKNMGFEDAFNMACKEFAENKLTSRI